MFRSLLFLVAIACSLNTQAQINDTQLFDQGNHLMGFSLRGSIGSRGSGAVGSVNFRYGHFIGTQTNLGGDVGFTRIDLFGRAIEAGPYLRYYFVPKNFSPIIEAHYAFGKVTTSEGPQASSVWHKFGTDLGITYSGAGLGNFGFELMMEYSVISFSGFRANAITYLGRLLYYF